MGLTEKEKRFIISPHSFSSKQQRMWRHVIKKKISQIIKDFEFITQNKDKIYQLLGENITVHQKVLVHSSDLITKINQNIEEHTDPKTEDSSETTDEDPDFL